MIEHDSYPTNKLAGIDQLLNAGDVARILKVSVPFVYQLIRQGKIPAIRLGRSVRVRPKDLKEFIAGQFSGEGCHV